MAGAWLLSQSRRRFVLSAVFQCLFFLLPPALPLANSATTFSLASPVFASQVAAPIVIALPAISAVQLSFHQSFHHSFQDRPGKPRFPPAWRVALIEALCFACLPSHPQMN